MALPPAVIPTFCYCFCNSVFLLLISFSRCLAFKQLVLLMKDLSCERTCLQSASEDCFTCVIFSVSGLEVLSLLTLMNCSDQAFCKDYASLGAEGIHGLAL